MAGSRHHISCLREAVQALRGPRAAATGGQGDAQLFEESHDVTPGGDGIFQGLSPGIFVGKFTKN